ncbi:inorganic pyrophosphatase [Crossiella equi]|uniref:Inorganic pyrophosphatase n=1 Tax=Crossiella equi TaxID=130796 RepID=A0ABS5AMM8_9PSEU|nr:inorganic pyrophosphatase [Crossiella equi]MBP2477833.1 inorganic pyrophosphatase [Crossiella equi]
MSPDFFALLDRLTADAALVIDRPRGTCHPKWPEVVYPVDYGYLPATRGGDGAALDVFRGSARGTGVRAVLLTADLGKRDVEVKVLLDCTDEEIALAHGLLRDRLGIGGHLVPRPTG